MVEAPNAGGISNFMTKRMKPEANTSKWTNSSGNLYMQENKALF